MMGLGLEMNNRWWRSGGGQSAFATLLAESIDLHDSSRLTVGRGSPTVSGGSWGGSDAQIGGYDSGTDGYLCDVSDLAPERLSVDLACWGDSMTRGAGTPNREVDFASILGSIIGNPLVYNRGVGGETSTQVKTRFDAEPARHADNTVIWVGHNGDAEATIVSNVEAMITSLGHTRYLVIGPVSGASIRSALEAAIPAANYLDPTVALVAKSGEADWASYRIDTIHLNEKGSLVVAQAAMSKTVEVFDMTTTTDTGLARTSGTFLIAYRPSFNDNIGVTTANIASAVPGGTGFDLHIIPNSGGVNNLVRLQHGFDADRVIANQGTAGLWPMVSGSWTTGVARYFCGTADIDAGSGRSNPAIEEGVLWNAIQTLFLGARGTPEFNKTSPLGDVVLRYIPRAITYDEMQAVLAAGDPS